MVENHRTLPFAFAKFGLASPNAANPDALRGDPLSNSRVVGIESDLTVQIIKEIDLVAVRVLNYILIKDPKFLFL